MKCNKFKFSSPSEAHFLQTDSLFHVHQAHEIQLALKRAI